MTIKELHEMNFNDAAELLYGEHPLITTYETLKEFAVHQINEDRLFLAIHILESIHNDPADFYSYDFCMGTLETPSPLYTSYDLEDYCDTEEPDNQ